MRKMMLMAAMVAIAALMLAAAPAFAQGDGMGQDKVTICHVPPGNPGNAHTITVGAPAAAAHLANHPGDRVGACNQQQENNNNNNNENNRNNVFVPNITQENEQNVESGDASQTITVSGGGANSNQCVGVQGVTNTGNSVNNTGVLQVGGFDGNNWNGHNWNHHNWNGWNNWNNGNNGEVEVGNGDFTISPSQTTNCNQQVNQAASATG